MRGVDAPADVIARDPEADRLQLALADLEALAHRAALQQLQHFARGEAASVQIQQPQEGARDAALRAHAAIRDGVGDARRLALRRAEDGLDVGRVRLHARHGHEHVLRREAGERVEELEELIVQHLHLAHRPVAAVDLDGAVAGGERRRARSSSPRTSKISACTCASMLPPAGGRKDSCHSVGSRSCTATLKARPARPKEASSSLPVSRCRSAAVWPGLRVALQDAPLLGRAAQVAPELIGRLEEKEVHLHGAADFREQSQVKRRQAGDAEDRDARGQARRAAAARPRISCASCWSSAGGCASGQPPESTRQSRACQPLLLAGIPLQQPLGHVGDVLVEDGRDLPRELELLHRARLIAADVAPQRAQSRRPRASGGSAPSTRHGSASREKARMAPRSGASVLKTRCANSAMNGKSQFMVMPSRRAIWKESQRRIPRLCTTTTSACSGSASGSRQHARRGRRPALRRDCCDEDAGR